MIILVRRGLWEVLLIVAGATIIAEAHGDRRQEAGGMVLVIVGVALFVQWLRRQGGERKQRRWERSLEEGTELAAAGQWTEAHEKFEQTIKETGTAKPRRLKADEAIAKLLLAHRHDAEAIPYLADALRINESLPGADAAAMADRVRLADLHLTLNEPDKAQELLERAVALAGSESSDLRRRLADVHLVQKRYEDALRIYTEVVAEVERTKGEWSVQLVDPLLGIAAVRADQGDLTGAEAALQKAHDCAHAAGSADRTQRARLGLLEVYRRQERLSDAADISSRYLSVATSEQITPAETMRLLREHCEVLRSAGRTEEAERFARRADILEATARPARREDGQARPETERHRRDWRPPWSRDSAD